MNKRHYEHTLPNIRGSLSNTYDNADYSKISVENLKTSAGKPWKKKNRTKSPPSK